MKIPFSRTIKRWINIRQVCRLKNWTFSSIRVGMLLSEWSDWEYSYLPVDVRGLRVLDVGAGEGETALFYLKHGAREVVCIEPDEKSFNILTLNAKRHPIVCLNKKFEISDLKIPHDLLKVDIEGYEELLLSTELEKPAVVEVHGLQLRDRFQEKGYKIIYSPFVSHHSKEFGCLSYAVWPGKKEVKL